MDAAQLFGLIFLGLLAFLALTFKPLRKAIGLLLIIFGVLASLTFFGIVVGAPMILIGGVLLFM